MACPNKPLTTSTSLTKKRDPLTMWTQNRGTILKHHTLISTALPRGLRGYWPNSGTLSGMNTLTKSNPSPKIALHSCKCCGGPASLLSITKPQYQPGASPSATSGFVIRCMGKGCLVAQGNSIEHVLDIWNTSERFRIE